MLHCAVACALATAGALVVVGCAESVAAPNADVRAGTGGQLANAVAKVRAFYDRYPEAVREHTVDGLIRSYAAGWYARVLAVPTGFDFGPPGCGFATQTTHLGILGARLDSGQAVVVVQWLPVQSQRHMAVVAVDRTGKFTGITCVPGGSPVSGTGARNATSSLYQAYLAARGSGSSLRAEVAALLAYGATASSDYLREVESALARGPLGYDPLLCARAVVGRVAVGQVRIVAEGAAGLVTVTPRPGEPILAVVTMGAKGWMVADVACPADPDRLAVGSR